MESKEIKQIRKALGLTQQQLADRLGVTWSTVARWECDLRRCSGAAVVLLKQLASRPGGTADNAQHHLEDAERHAKKKESDPR